MNYKNIILILSIITISYAHAAQPLAKKAKCNIGPCYFSMLPADICDLIAHYLTFDDIESKEEFIERTKTTIKKEINLESFFSEEYLPEWRWGDEAPTSISVFCPNAINVALLEVSRYPAKLTIVNVKKKLIHMQELEKKDYDHIALSRNAAMFATIHEHRERDRRPSRFDTIRYIITSFITIQNIATQKSEIIEFPASFGVACKKDSVPLAFNKQGTHIILHGVDYTKTNNISSADMAKDPMPHHMIFPVTVNEQNVTSSIESPQNDQKTILLRGPQSKCNKDWGQKTLQYYFQQRGICKDITISLNK